MSRYGLFQIGEFRFAVALEYIKKILQNSKTYKLPQLPGVVVAVLVDAGQLVPLLDLSQIVGEESRLKDVMLGYQVLVESEYGPVALSTDKTGQIVVAQKGKLSITAEQATDFGVVGKFIYQNEEYNLLDINLLAVEMTQGFWQNQFDTGDARRCQ
jgi:chemotaxis signal transduction protein